MIEVDALDSAVMRELEVDGRLSNREVARRLGISEGTVRHRLKRLLDAGAIRIGVIADPHRLGLPHSAVFWVNVVPRQLDAALAVMTRLSEIALVGVVAGRWNVMIVGSVADQEALLDLTRTLRAISGVTEVIVRRVMRTTKHNVGITRVAEPNRRRALAPEGQPPKQ